MSTRLGSLTLDLIARIGGYVGPIRDAERQTETSFANMRKHVNSYGAIAISGAVAVGTGVLAMANEYANAARELQTFASISNTTTQEFQKMAVGAETMGISQEQLSDQLKDFQEKLGEFTTIGSGGAVDFFEQIAIKTEGSAEGARKLALEMQNLSGPKALQLYVDKLEEAGVTQQQMSFYLESMASDTTNLIPLLRDGGKGFEYWADAAERAGVIMDESAIAKAAELRVQMDLLNLQVEGAKNQFIQGLMPALVSVGDGMSSASHETNLMSEAGETLGEVFKGVAATGMGVYAVVKMLSNAIAGLALTAVEAKNNVDKSAEKGSWADNLPGVKLAKTLITGSVLARAPNSGVAMAAQDNAKVVDDVANSINRIYNNTVNQSAAAMAKIQSSQAGVTKGSDEWIKKQNEAAKAATSSSKANSDAAKALREYNQALELGKRLIYEYGDEQLRISEDLKKDLEEIQSASLKPEAKERYSTVAKMQADARKKLYIAELDLELNEHKFTEEEKLKTELNINKLRLDSQRGLNENELKLRKETLGEKYQEELFYIQLTKEQQLLQAQQSYMHEVDAMQERYRLERKEIEKIKDEKQKAGLLNASYRSEDNDYESKRRNAWDNYRNMGAARDGTGEFLQLDFAKENASKTIEDSVKFNLITEQQAKIDLLKVEEDYQKAKLQLTLSYGERIAGSVTDSMATIFGEQSGAYKAMFAVQKGFAIAQSMIAIQQGIANAMSLPFPTNLAAVAIVAAETASILSNIRSVTMTVAGGDSGISGMAHDGIDNIPKEGTWLLDKGERVVDSRTNADLKNMIANGSNGSPQININVPPGYTAEQSRGADGAVTIDIVEQYIVNSLQQPNSKVRKALAQNTNATARR